MNLEQSHAVFPATQWTLIEVLRSPDHPEHEAALRTLLTRYWPPVYAFLRRSGRGRDTAAELTQAFFADVVVARGLFDRAESRRGRLRTLLLTALQRYLRDCNRRANARCRDLTVSVEQLEREEADLADDRAEAGPEAFERRWAVAMLEEALTRCEDQFCSSGRQHYWDAFESHVLRPSVAMSDAPPLAYIAEQLGFPSAEQVSGALRVARKRIHTLLKQVIAETVEQPEEQEVEFRRITSILS